MNAETYSRFRDALKVWVGTPHKHLRCDKGGADCGLFILKTMYDIGMVAQYNILEHHSRLWYYLTDKEIIIDAIKKISESYMIPPHTLQETAMQETEPGDILTFSIGGNGKTNHIAVLLENDEVIHSTIKGAGVHITDFIGYTKYLTHSYRVE